MQHNDTTALSGIIRHIFAHRFVLETEGKFHLADLGPKGAETFPLTEGLTVSIIGERRPSEIKVTEIAAPGLSPVSIHHKKPNHPPGPARSDVKPDIARVLEAAAKAGWTTQGKPHGKPKHFEVLARQGAGSLTELHIDFAGAIYKTKLPDAAKWGEDLG